VILLHGVPQTSACWLAQLEALGDAGYHGVAFTQRGYSPGARVDDLGEFTLDKLAGDVLGVADALKIGTFDVVGHDAGACVAWTLAAFHADRVDTLTVASVPHPAAFSSAYREGKGSGEGSQHSRSNYMRQIVNLPRGEMERRFVENDGTLMRAAFTGLPSSSVQEYIDTLGTVEGMRGVLDWYRAGALRIPGVPRAIDPEFPDIDIPTLYVWSDEDPAIGPAGAYATERHVTGPYRFVVLQGIGHWIPETAADKFTTELLAHLDAHPRRA
jgi:pimeloyl-ACP methyl ester carboxylesterase